MKSKKIKFILTSKNVMGIAGYLSEPDGRIKESNNQFVANRLKPLNWRLCTYARLY